ncbi:cell division protein PerM [Nocardia sp. R6R-6]|uniref:cell division protein PerM n=1 Tax=Nocardia sp. R6R-6 TaxID=3459303 RepID=UPI00403DB3C8
MNPRTSSTRRAGASRAPQPATDADEAGFLSLTPERSRVLIAVAARPAAFGLTTFAVLVLGTLLTSGSDLAGASGAVAASWLGAHQVPLVIGKTSLGLLPLLPTALVLWLAARECARAVEPDCTKADLGWIVGAALGGPLLVTSVCLAVTEDASGVIALRPPNTLSAFTWVAALHLLAAATGIATRIRRLLFVLLRLPDWAVSGLYGAGRSVLRLLGCATVVVVVSIGAHIARIGDTYQSASDAVGVFGLTLLSLLYLPNLVVHAVGVLVGSSAHIGAASFGVFSVVGGPIPAFPLLAAIPTGPAQGWWMVLLLVPAGVGVLGGLDCARTSTDRITAPWATLSSAALAALALTVAGAVAGGELGTFGRMGLDPAIFAVITFAWLAIPGYASLLFARWFLVPVGVPPADYTDPYDDYDRDYDDPASDYDAGNDYDAEDDYDDDRDDRVLDYDRPALEGALDAELLDEPTTVGTGHARRGALTAEIVDAEVVETDLPDGDRVDGR